MTFPKSLALWIDRLKGEAHSYACDYAAWWLEGGREPNVDDYIQEDDAPRARFGHGQALRIAARIRQAVSWRAEEPPDSPRACKGACDWTKTHISNTSVTKTLCGLDVPEYPYTSDVGIAQVPPDWPKCKRCLAKVYAWGEGNGRAFLETVG